MQTQLNRRYFFLGSLALAGCGGVTSAKRMHNVSVLRVESYQKDLTGMVRRLLRDHDVPVADRRIVLKPNLVEFDRARPINTHAVFVASVEQAFLASGAKQVRIAEGPGHRRATLDMAEAAGYFEAVSGFETRFIDLNLDNVHRTRLRSPFSKLKELYLPETVLDCDLLVSLPKLKTHHWTGATLSMKNLFGVVPGAVYGWPKNPLHWAGIDESVADLHNLFPRQFAIVDGIEGMEGNGPILGSAKQSGVIVAGDHPPSVDATCCRIMRIDPAQVGYLKLLARRPDWFRSGIRQTGESIDSVAIPFALPPGLEHLRMQGGAV